jgi:MYXO-CTERM domain-containing protein
MVGGALAIAIAGTMWIAAPQVASACSCYGESRLVAPLGDEHPLGAAVFFVNDCGGDLEAWSVTVDGVAATLADGGAWAPIKGIAIEPAPAMGAEVVLSVACNAVFDEPACTDPEGTVERARFTIAGPDTTAPPAIDAITLEQEAGEFLLGCDETKYDLRLGAVVEIGTAEPSTWAEITFTKSGEEIARNSLVIPASGVVEWSHYVERSELAGSEACIGVTVRDAAGNATELEQDCTEIGGGCGCAAEDPTRNAVMVALGALVLLVSRRRSLTACAPRPPRRRRA